MGNVGKVSGCLPSFRLREKELLSLPAHAVLGVFQDDAAPGELVANFVAPIKVAAMTRFLALVDQLLNLSIKNLRLRLAKDIQHTVNAIYRSDYLPFVFFAQAASGQHGIHFAREIVDGSERDGRV